MHLHLYLFLSFFLHYRYRRRTHTGTDNRRPVRYCQSRAVVIVTENPNRNGHQLSSFPNSGNVDRSFSISHAWVAQQTALGPSSGFGKRPPPPGRAPPFSRVTGAHFYVTATGATPHRLLVSPRARETLPPPVCHRQLRLMTITTVVHCLSWHVTCEDRQTFADLSCVCVRLSLSPHSFPIFLARFL